MITNQTTFPSTLSAETSERSHLEVVFLRSRKRWLIAFFFCATFGLLNGIFGLGLTALAATGFLQPQNSSDPEIIALLGTCFPLLFLAAHCMDKIREMEQRVRVEYCKRLGSDAPRV